MKKILFGLLAFLTVNAMAQTTGRFEVHDFGTFKLHVYYTNDALGDASYIIEGQKGLVTLEQPLMKLNAAEYDRYLLNLGKGVKQRITSYHLGSTADHKYVSVSGMPAFMKGPVYGGMMAGFQQMFGDAMTDLPTGEVSEVDFGSVNNWAGVDFEFRHGASSDFPGASIIIGRKIYYTHWTPAKAHVSALQVSSAQAIDAEIIEAQNELASGCELFIGGHGGAAGRDAVEFKIDYLTTARRLLSENSTAEEFAVAMRAAYPALAGEENLDAFAKALYK